MTTVGVNEAIPQGHHYGFKENCCPSCWLCCGYGCMGCLIYNMVVPCLIGRRLWDDMGHSEDVMRREDKIKERTIIVRPTNMHPAEAHNAFTEEWRNEGGENLNYAVKMADEDPPNMWMNRRAIAAFLLDCVEDTKYDGKAVSLFQGKPDKK